MEDLVEEGLTMLQYADDTVFVFEDSREGARNLKFVLYMFEHLSGLKINFHKSEIFCFGKAKDKVEDYMTIFTCVEGKLHMKYLGVPLLDKKLRNVDWVPSEEKVGNRAGSWKGKFTSYGPRLILLKSCLSNVPFYMMSMYTLPKGPCKRIDLYRKRLLWHEEEGKRKISFS